jgi:hypothetical protein
MKPIQFASTIESVKPLKDGSMSLTFHTQEMTNEDKLNILNLLGKFGWLLFKEDIKEWNEAEVPKEDSGYDDGISPQKRLRGVIFRVWEQTKKKDCPDFEVWYRRQIEALISQYKERLL